jgi:hypothetical protein
VTDQPIAIIVGHDPGTVGALVADLQARGVRVGAFIGDADRDRDALVEMLAELYAGRANPD